MHADAPTASRRFTPATFFVRIGSQRSRVRAAAIWPIAEVLDGDAFGASPSATSGGAADARLALDLIDSGMIAPPRSRRRRDRRVSSRAVFYQSAGA